MGTNHAVQPNDGPLVVYGVSSLRRLLSRSQPTLKTASGRWATEMTLFGSAYGGQTRCGLCPSVGFRVWVCGFIPQPCQGRRTLPPSQTLASSPAAPASSRKAQQMLRNTAVRIVALHCFTYSPKRAMHRYPQHIRIRLEADEIARGKIAALSSGGCTNHPTSEWKTSAR